MKYTVEHSSIACAIYVYGPDGTKHDCIYMAKDKPVQEGVYGTEKQAVDRFLALPLEVRAAVNRQFGEVFSLPNDGSRAAWVKAQVPFVVNVYN